MKKEDAIAYLAILPILPLVWLHVELLIPLSWDMFSRIGDDIHRYPLLARWPYYTTTGNYVVPSQWVLGLVATIVLVAFVRIDRLRIFFPVALSMTWAVMFVHVLLTSIGFFVALRTMIPYW
jgi:hypothetical protein